MKWMHQKYTYMSQVQQTVPTPWKLEASIFAFPISKQESVKNHILKSVLSRTLQSLYSNGPARTSNVIWSKGL